MPFHGAPIGSPQGPPVSGGRAPRLGPRPSRRLTWGVVIKRRGLGLTEQPFPGTVFGGGVQFPSFVIGRGPTASSKWGALMGGGQGGAFGLSTP
eukprot:7153660-Pyramimonas_sp.AAC.1